MEGGFHFNVFTVDFNEELVALYGGSLLKQTHFLHESIKAILRLYKVRPPRAFGGMKHVDWSVNHDFNCTERNADVPETKQFTPVLSIIPKDEPRLYRSVSRLFKAKTGRSKRHRAKNMQYAEY